MDNCHDEPEMMRKQYIRLDSDDRVVGGGMRQNTPNNSEEFTYIESDADLNSMLFSENHFVWDGSAFIDTGQPKSATPTSVWSKDQRKWLDGRTIDQQKDDKWLEIKAARNAQEFGTFDCGGYTFQCDEVSQRRIQGAVQLAMMDASFSIDWTLLDNSVITLTSQEMIEVGQYLAAHVNACHVKSRALREQIDAAQSLEAINLIEW